jgi:uncharacterized protein
MRYDWDLNKAAANVRKHGISFQQATAAFRDPLKIEELDDREDYGEDRIKAIGMVQGVLLCVVYTESDDVIRIISARKATKASSVD